ncbi:DMT family transporter [Thalassotalea ponticola]|uniref:DMT family transporter n=1 Tax=Thalassotalea ponticola TaxID=1523392 RepID=UPI0025B295C0|nr:DMT family transporter [Thalassotalea ponticola]MDN3652396.1 DMT family transporter [Thalassotalea ponticola]
MLAVCALFAKWIELPALYIVWGRCLFAFIALYIVSYGKQLNLNINARLRRRLLISGVLLALHWWSFFQSIQLTNVAVGLLTFATFPLFVPLINRVLLQQTIQPILLVQGLLCILGVYLLVAHQPVSDATWLGVVLGVFSALSFALLTVFNHHYVQQHNPVVISVFQQGAALIWLTPWLFVWPQLPSTTDWLAFAVLGVFFTALTHALIIYCLRFLPAFTVSVSFSLEPVYGIVAAYFLLGESISTPTVIGSVLIVVTCAWASISSMPRSVKA